MIGVDLDLGKVFSLDGNWKRSLRDRQGLSKTGTTLCGNTSLLVVVSWVEVVGCRRECGGLLDGGEETW